MRMVIRCQRNGDAKLKLFIEDSGRVSAAVIMMMMSMMSMLGTVCEEQRQIWTDLFLLVHHVSRPRLGLVVFSSAREM